MVSDNINLSEMSVLDNLPESISYDEEPWTIIGSYFRGDHLKQLVRHQIESYNTFIRQQIPDTIAMFKNTHIRSDQDYDKDLNAYRYEMFINFENFKLHMPEAHETNGSTRMMFPNIARERNFSYSGNMTVDLNIKYVVRRGKLLELEETFFKVFNSINIGKMPIMVKSAACVLEHYKHVLNQTLGECNLDSGGYFIINGSEKTCIAQERVVENKVQCFNISKNNPKWSWVAEIKSIPESKNISPKQLSAYLSSKNNGFGHTIFVQLPRMKTPVPLFIVFRAFGVISDKDICEIICAGDDSILPYLRASVVDSNEILTQEKAIIYLTNVVMYTPINVDKETGSLKKTSFMMDVLNNDIFPHCRTKEQRVHFMGYMVNKLIKCSVGDEPGDDRDSFTNKRIDTTGPLLLNLFRNYLNKMIKDIQKQIIREINIGSWRSTEDFGSVINMTNMYKIIKSTTIENGIKRALSTGDFGVKQPNTNKVGVAQVLNRLTYVSALSHLRRVNTPIDKTCKLIPPRKLHPTSWGFTCPAESPEGGSVGVVKNLSYLAHITTSSNGEILQDIILPYIVPVGGDKGLVKSSVKMFINGSCIGYIKDSPIELYELLKLKKYKGIINIYTSVVFDFKRLELRVCNDAGRLTRPMLKVKNNKLLITPDIIADIKTHKLSWDDLLTDFKIPASVIEYIDSAEQNSSMIAMMPTDLVSEKDVQYNYTHCEIHPSTIFGILASCIPFPEHNQSPRNTYQCAMGKQAMGMYVTNFDVRMDKTAYVLTYPMRPLVETRIMNMIGLNQIPSGCQVIVAIMTHTGYNQEDSILFNKGSIDRGLFQATIYHTEKDEDKKVNGDDEIRCKPDKTKTKGMFFGNYDKVDITGLMELNELVENKDIIIAKVSQIKEARNDHSKVIKYEDKSKIYKTTEETYIDKKMINRNADGYTCCKVRLRSVRKPIIGDKFSSRHGQKGTIGNIIPECDMPFNADGIRPDIIINPHAIPSRMTIAQLKETVLGKTLLSLGLFGDGTSFGVMGVKDICNELQKVGYESNGNELLYNGLTGEQLETSVFIGPVFYQRLKHMVTDKQHSRGIGPMMNLTRQPAEGRSKDGGLRFGEMERDCMCAHGASRFTRGRMYDASDAFSVHVCKKCGMIASYNDEKHIHLCKMCENRTDFSYVELPYSCKLMFQELITMNIAPRILT